MADGSATKLASAYVELHPWLSTNFSRDLDKLIAKEDVGRRSGEETGERYSKSLIESISSNLDSFASKTDKVGSALTKGITVPALGAAGAIGSIFVAKGWDRLTAIDTAESKLKGLGYTGASIKGIMDSALASVKGTAYGLGDAANVAVGALAAGVREGDDLTQVLKTIADTATIAGGDFEGTATIFNKVMAKGKAQGDEILQLSEKGVPVLQTLAKELGVTAEEAQQMASDGEISFEVFERAMRNAFGGAALASGESMKGTIDNVWAAVGRVGASFLDSGDDGQGFFTRLKPLLADFTNDIDGMQAKASEWGSVFGDVFFDIIDFARDAIEVFDDLPESQKKGIVQLGLMAVASGPALKGISKLSSGTSMLITGMDKFSSITGKAKNGLLDFCTSSNKADRVSSSFARTLDGFSGVGKTALFGGIIAGLGLCAAAFVNAYQKEQNLTNATEGLRSAVAGASGEISSSFGGAAKTHVKSVSEMLSATDNMIAKQSELADSIRESNTNAFGEMAELDAYKQTISDLTNSYDEFGNKIPLTAEEQTRLKAAIDKVNDACGTQFSVVDAANAVIADEAGVISDASSAIDTYIEKKKLQLQLDAMEGNYSDLLKQREEATKNYTEALKTQTKAHEEYQKAVEYSLQGGDQTGTMLRDAEANYNAATIALNQNRDALQSASGAVTELESRMDFLNQGIAGNTSAWEEWLLTSGTTAALFAENSAAAGGYQEKLQNLASDLQVMGADQSKFAALGIEDMTSLSTAYDGSISSIIGKLTELGVVSNTALTEIATDSDLMSERVATAFSDAGVSQDDFIAKLAESEISVQDFKDLTTDQLAQLVEAYSTNNGQINDQLMQFVEQNRQAGTDGVSSLTSAMYEGQEEVSLAAQAVMDSAGNPVAALPSQYNQISQDAVLSLSSGLGDTGEVAAASSAQAAAAVSGVSGVTPLLSAEGTNAANSFGSGLGNTTITAVKAELQKSLALKGIQGTSDGLKREGDLAGSSFADALGSRGNYAYLKSKDVAHSAEQGIGTGNGGRLGIDFGSGYVIGIQGQNNAAYWAGWNLGKSALRGTQDAQRSSSPAKEAIDLGEDYGDGYGIGIAKRDAFVGSMSSRLVDSAKQPMEKSTQANWYATIPTPARTSASDGTSESIGILSNLLTIMTTIHDDLLSIYEVIPEGLSDRDFGRKVRRVIDGRA